MRLVTCCLLLLPLLLAGCCSGCRYYNSAGAEEFVIDSYRIQQGKFSILEMEGCCYSPLDPRLLEEYPDAIADGDVLEIALYHPSRCDLTEAVTRIGISVGYTVRDGMIRLPDLSPVAVADLNLSQARDAIEEQYREQISDVEIFLRYKHREVRKVEFIGPVAVPQIPVDGKLRLYEALSIAKVTDCANLFMSYIVRDGCALPVDMNKLVRCGDMCQNIVLRGGDKIYIASPAESRVMVMGEVGHPRAIPLPEGSMSLREALVTANGIPYTGNKSCIQVIRGNIVCPKIYTLNWHNIVHLPNRSLLLMPGDTVYVAAKPVTEWNRFISQLLPTFTGAQTMYSSSVLVGGACIP